MFVETEAKEGATLKKEEDKLRNENVFKTH